MISPSYNLKVHGIRARTRRLMTILMKSFNSNITQSHSRAFNLSIGGGGGGGGQG